MNPTLLDIAILFSFVPVWAGLCWAYESGHDPRARDVHKRNARWQGTSQRLTETREVDAMKITTAKRYYKYVTDFGNNGLVIETDRHLIDLYFTGNFRLHPRHTYQQTSTAELVTLHG